MTGFATHFFLISSDATNDSVIKDPLSSSPTIVEFGLLADVIKEQ
jgi:hypothetical protein